MPGVLSRFARALVVGCGTSGIAAAALLRAAGCEVRLFDARAGLDGLPAALADCPRYFGQAEAPAEAWAELDLLVLSPGVPPGPWRAAHAELAPRAEIHGELSLALAAIEGDWDEGAQVPTVLITGTNGKSTVTALTGALVEAGGLAPFVGGNLGIPLSRLVLDVAEGRADQPGALVLECSSYQLETIRADVDTPATRVAMVLNVSPDHLARYDSIEHYADTKGRVFAGLAPGGLALLSANDAFAARLAARIPAHARRLIVDGDAPPRLGVDDRLELRADEHYPRASLGLAGRHNGVNALFALLAARHLGVSAAECARGLAEFRALPHRMNPIAEREGVVYFDDSKATNVAAVLAGLDGFERRFVLICGGQAKRGDDIGSLREVLAARGRGLVAIGESAAQFLAMAEGVVPTARAPDMHAAVRRASEMAAVGDAVLLSPACASWDMYRSFVHRGEVFAAAVAALDDGA